MDTSQCEVHVILHMVWYGMVLYCSRPLRYVQTARRVACPPHATWRLLCSPHFSPSAETEHGHRGAPRLSLSSERGGRGHEASWGNSPDIKTESVNPGTVAFPEARSLWQRWLFAGVLTRGLGGVVEAKLCQRELNGDYSCSWQEGEGLYFCVHDPGWCWVQASKPVGD